MPDSFQNAKGSEERAFLKTGSPSAESVRWSSASGVPARRCAGPAR